MTGTAVVTGGGGGLGGAICRRLAADGFSVAVLEVDLPAARAVCEAIESDKGVAQAYEVDVRDVARFDAAIARAAEELGPIKGMVNNAAIFPSGPFLESTPEEYDDVMAVNQRAYFFGAQIAARHMREDGGGAIVNIGSITQYGGWGEMASYVAAKGAAHALTRALATELGPCEIRVNCVAPGAFPTRAEGVHPDREAYTQRILASQALKRRGTFEELASTVSFLLGPDSSFVTGQTLNVNGGWIMS